MRLLSKARIWLKILGCWWRAPPMSHRNIPSTGCSFQIGSVGRFLGFLQLPWNHLGSWYRLGSHHRSSTWDGWELGLDTLDRQEEPFLSAPVICQTTTPNNTLMSFVRRHLSAHEINVMWHSLETFFVTEPCLFTPTSGYQRLLTITSNAYQRLFTINAY